MTSCRIYRSEREAETYLYVADTLELADLPRALRTLFDPAGFVMRLDIGPQTRLARVAATDVIRALERDGYFLQLPPDIPVDEEIGHRIG